MLNGAHTDSGLKSSSQRSRSPRLWAVLLTLAAVALIVGAWISGSSWAAGGTSILLLLVLLPCLLMPFMMMGGRDHNASSRETDDTTER